MLIGDVYRSFHVSSPKTQAELALERLDDKTRISLKPRFRCKMDASCVAVYICDILAGKKSESEAVVADEQLEMPAMQRGLSQVQVQVDARYDLKDCSLISAS